MKRPATVPLAASAALLLMACTPATETGTPVGAEGRTDEATSALTVCSDGYALIPNTLICVLVTVTPIHGVQCPIGGLNIPGTSICVPPGSRYDGTPGAGGCPHGAAFTPFGNVICLASGGGPLTPPAYMAPIVQ
jgi:hypothetical protein